MAAETIDQLTFQKYQEKKQALLNTKEQIISQLPLGTMIYKGGTVYPERYKIVNQDKGYTEVKRCVWDGESFLGYVESKLDAHRLDMDGVVAYTVNDETKFFTQNPLESLRVVDDLICKNHFAQANEKERLDSLVYGTFFNLVDFDKFKVKLILSDDVNYYQLYKKKIPKKYGQMGYWDFSFKSGSFAENNYNWVIEYFGQKLELAEEVMEQTLNQFVKKVLSTPKEALNTLNEYELLSFYTLNGWQVQRNYMTLETTFKHPFSTKEMHIQFDELFDYDNIVQKWTIFSQVVGEYKAPMERAKYRNISVKSKYAVPNEQLKAFKVPTGSLYIFDKAYAEQLAGNLYYEVLNDDGKNVLLRAVERPNVFTKVLKPIADLPNVTAPRKVVTMVKFGEHLGDKTKQELFDIPFAIQVSQAETGAQIVENTEAYHNALTWEEKIQLSIYTKYAYDQKMLQAFAENDLVAAKLVMEQNKNSSGNIERGNPLGLDDYSLYKELVNMYCAIQRFDEDDMTLAELMFAYRMKGKEIRYCGHLTHFIIDEVNVVHSTRHNIFEF